MKKIDNLSRCLDVLRRAELPKAGEDEIYRMGLIGQFHLSFELAWKALQAVLLGHGVQEAATGSPREILKLGYRVGFLQEETVWLDMLRSRNLSVHVYNEAEASALSERILTRYLPALDELLDTLRAKAAEIEAPEQDG